MIRTLAIEHYRGFFAARNFDLARPTGAEGSGLTVLVGPNNSGKSTVLNALRLILYPRQVDLEHRHPDKMLKVSITNDAGQTKSVSNPDLGANLVLSGDVNARPLIDNFRLVPSRRSWSPYTGHQTMATNDYWQNTLHYMQEGPDNYLVSRVASLKVQQREQFDALLTELLPQINTWKVELSRGQTFVLYETHSGARHAADLFGDGMASIFRIALALFDSSPDHFVAIDEPELSLHPQAQKVLAAVLSKFARDRQILITTHSPYFVSWHDISNGTVIYRLTQEKDGVSVGQLKPKTLSDLRGLVSDWQKPNLLDAVSREVFFADEVVFFEGQEDVGLLKRFAAESDLEALPAFGYGAGGAGNIKYFLRMAQDLGIRSAAVFDGDHAATAQSVAIEFPSVLIEVLPTADIRDKMKRDADGRETSECEKEGLFDRSGKVKPEYQAYLNTLFEKIWKHLSVEAPVGDS